MSSDYHWHYGDVIMSTTASQITSLTIVYSTVYSVQIPHKWPVTRKCFHLMAPSWYHQSQTPMLRPLHMKELSYVRVTTRRFQKRFRPHSHALAVRFFVSIWCSFVTPWNWLRLWRHCRRRQWRSEALNAVSWLRLFDQAPPPPPPPVPIFSIMHGQPFSIH